MDIVDIKAYGVMGPLLRAHAVNREASFFDYLCVDIVYIAEL